MKNRGTVFTYKAGNKQVTVYWIKPTEGIQAPFTYGYKVEDGDSEVWGSGMKTLPEARAMAGHAVTSFP